MVSVEEAFEMMCKADEEADKLVAKNIGLAKGKTEKNVPVKVPVKTEEVKPKEEKKTQI